MSVSLYFSSHLQLEQHRHSSDAGNQVLSSSQFNSKMSQNSDSDSSVNSIESTSVPTSEKPSCLPDKLIQQEKDGEKISVSTSTSNAKNKNTSEEIQLDQLENRRLEKDQNFLEMIKSRPKRPKVNTNRPRRLSTAVVNSDQSLVDKKTKVGKENIDLSAGLEIFFQSPSTQLRREKFANDETCEKVSLRSVHRISLVLPSEKRLSLRKEQKEDDECGEKNKEDESKLSAKHEKVSRSKSSPSIDPTKLFPGMDPRLSVSMIKELRTRQTSSDKTPNRLSHPLISELKLQNLRGKTSQSLSGEESDKKPGPKMSSSKKPSVKDRISAFGELSKPNIQSSTGGELARKGKNNEAKTKSSQSNEEPTRGGCEKDSSKNGDNVGRKPDEKGKEEEVPKMGGHELASLRKNNQDKEKK